MLNSSNYYDAGMELGISHNHFKMVHWYVYILECADGSYYTGIAKDPHKRFEIHRSGKGARYTKIKGVKKIVYIKKFANHKLAAISEIEIKKLSRKEKVNLVVTQR